MPKSRRKAGQNIRELALKRRLKAINYFFSAGLIVGFPLFLLKHFQNLFNSISSSNPSQPQPSLNFPLIYYLLFITISLGLAANGIYLWKLANRADRGAKGEEDTCQEMLQLVRDGWQIEYGMRLGNRLGDVDIVCISPQKKVYAIDVKSHRGEVVTTDGKQLFRRMGKTTYAFEKNFLDLAMKQALQVKKQKNFHFVTPIVAFSDAKVSLSSDRLQKVYVVEKSNLVSLLKSLG